MKTKHTTQQIKMESAVACRLLTLCCHVATLKNPFLKHSVFIGILNNKITLKNGCFHFAAKRWRDRRDGVIDFYNVFFINDLPMFLGVTPLACQSVTGVTDGGLFAEWAVFGGCWEVFTAYKKGLTASSGTAYPCRSSAQSEDGIRNPDNTKPHQHRPQTVLFLCKSVCSLWRIVWGSLWAGRFPLFPVLRTPYNLPPLNRFVTVGGSFLNYKGACHYA